MITSRRGIQMHRLIVLLLCIPPFNQLSEALAEDLRSPATRGRSMAESPADRAKNAVHPAAKTGQAPTTSIKSTEAARHPDRPAANAGQAPGLRETIGWKTGHHFVNSLAFSPDGALMATAHGEFSKGYEGPEWVELWNVANGKHLMTLKSLPEDASCVAFSPDGKILAAGGDNGRIVLWDFAVRSIRAELGVLHNPDIREVRSLVFALDGRILASVTRDGSAQFWGVARGRDLQPADLPATSVVNAAAFSPEGRPLLLTRQRQRVFEARIDDNQPPAPFDDPPPEKFDLILRDAKTGEKLWNHELVWSARLSMFSPDAKWLLRCDCSRPGPDDNLIEDHESIIFLDAKTGREVATARAGAAINCATFSPDGNLVAIGTQSLNRAADVMTLWDSATGKAAASIVPGGGVTALAFSPDGKRLATGGDLVRLWDVAEILNTKPAP